MSKTKTKYNTRDYEKTPPSIIKVKKYKMEEKESDYDLNHLFDEFTKEETDDETLRD